MRIDLSCASCGANRFNFPQFDGDEAIIMCDDCGHEVGTLGSLKARVEQAVLKRAVLRKTAAKKASKRSR